MQHTTPEGELLADVPSTTQPAVEGSPSAPGAASVTIEEEPPVASEDAVADDEGGDDSFLSFRPNYSKPKNSPSKDGGDFVVERKVYDRDVVMSFRLKCTTAPTDFLKHLTEEEQQLLLHGDEFDAAGGKMNSPPLSPSSANKGSSSSRSSGNSASGRGSEGEGKEGASIVSPTSSGASSPSVTPLKPGKGAWIAPSAIGNLGMSSETKVVGNAKGILNKLTDITFEKLSAELVALLNKHSEQLEEFVSIIFEKVCVEPTFCEMYAKLVVKLCEGYRHGDKAKTKGEMRKKVLRVVLEKCQAEFESNEKADRQREKLRAEKAKREREKSLAVIEGTLTQAQGERGSSGLEPLDNDKEREMELEFLHRYKKLGNVTFIGELFRLGLIPEKTIHGCVFYLLRNVKNPLEEDIEHLCKLLTIAGKEMDTPRAKPYMDQYFGRIEQLTKRTSIPARFRFMLQDVIELRASGWARPRNGPSTAEAMLGPASPTVSPLRPEGPPAARMDAPEAVLLSSGEVARIKQEMRFIVEEYVVSEDVDEVVMSVRDLKFGDRSVEFRAIFVYMSMIFAMERGVREQKLICRAFPRLKEAGLLSPSDFIKCWSKVIEELGEIEKDITFVRSYLADFIVSAIQTNCVTEKQFSILLQKHKTDNCKAIFEMVDDLLKEGKKQ